MSKVKGIRERVHHASLAGPLKVTIEHDGLGAYDPYPFERSGTPQGWGDGLEHDFDASVNASAASGAKLTKADFGIGNYMLGDADFNNPSASPTDAAPTSALVTVILGAAAGVALDIGYEHFVNKKPVALAAPRAAKWGAVGALVGIFARGVIA